MVMHLLGRGSEAESFAEAQLGRGESVVDRFGGIERWKAGWGRHAFWRGILWCVGTGLDHVISQRKGGFGRD